MTNQNSRIAAWLIKAADMLIPSSLPYWGEAMRVEALYANDEKGSIHFAWGCLVASARLALSYHVIHPITARFTTTVNAWDALASMALVTSLGVWIMSQSDNLSAFFTNLTLVFAALKIAPIFMLGFNKSKVANVLDNPVHAVLYFTSKLSGVLTAAFALAAAVSAGKIIETYVLTAVLVVATGLTFWTIFARFTGRFYGFAQIGRPS